MKIGRLQESNITKAVKILLEYWRSRGMQYSLEYALEYLKKEHTIEILEDNLFVIRNKEGAAELASLIVYEGNVGEIRDFTIKEEFRSKGFGSKLLSYILEFAKRRNLRKVFVLALSNANEFYKKNGFKGEGRLKSHFKKCENLTIMSKFLE